MFQGGRSNDRWEPLNGMVFVTSEPCYMVIWHSVSKNGDWPKRWPKRTLGGGLLR